MVVTGFGGLIFVVSLATVYYRSIPKIQPKQLQVYTDAAAPNLFPEIDWEEIPSGRMLTYLEGEDKAGRLAKVATTAQAVGAGEMTQIDVGSISFVRPGADNRMTDKYKNSATKPYGRLYPARTSAGD